MVVYSKAQFDKEGVDGYVAKPAGTGAYQFVERQPGAGVTFERVADHWQGTVPDFEMLELRWKSEPATKLALLLSGEAHIGDLPREIQAEALAAGKTIIKSKNPAMSTGAIFNGMYGKSGDPARRDDPALVGYPRARGDEPRPQP